MTEKKKKRFTIELDDETVGYLQVLCGNPSMPMSQVEDVLLHLAHSAADGVRRPGAWECGWLCQAFGDEWESKCEQVPDLAYSQLRPRRGA